MNVWCGAAGSDGDGNAGRMEDAVERFGGDLDEETAPPAVDVEMGEGEDRGLGVDRDGFAGAEGTGAANEVAGVAGGGVGGTGGDGFDTEMAGELLGGDLAITVHEDDKGLLCVGFHDEGLDGGVLVDPELFGGAAGAAVILVVVGAGLEVGFGGAEGADGGGDGDVHGDVQWGMREV